MPMLDISVSAARTGDVKVVTAHEFPDLSSHRAAWDRLAWDAPQRVPTILPAWVESSLRHGLRPSERWFCVFAYRGDLLVGVLPVIVTPQLLLGSARPRLRTIYDGVTTFTGDIPLSRDRSGAVLDALLSEARRQVPGHTGVAFRSVRQSSPLWEALNQSIHGYVVRPGEEVSYSRVDLAGWHESLLSSNLRRNLKRYRVRLEGKGQVEVRIEPARPGESLLTEFLALEAAGWKGRAGTAILQRPRELAFYTDLINTLREQGRLEWQTVRVGGRLIAAGFGVRCGDALVLPKIAYDEEFADYSPGSLLTHAVMVDASARNLCEINHLSRADWHGYWQMDKDRYSDVLLVRSAMLPLVWQSLTTAGRHVVRSVKDQVRHRLPGVAVAYRRFKRQEASGDPSA
jgi:CelD/BcsL family acetyltransferase involved in cellulose biosynthesis